ncbi:hypothetical protein D3C87_649870 [compost metagenome]
MEENENLVTLIDEDGKEQDFEIMEVVQIHGNSYALLTPANASEEEAEVLILKVVDDTLVNIEDEAEFNHVVSHLQGHAHH